MDDADEVEKVAEEFLASHGPSVILDLRERAEVAIERGPPARIMDSLRELRSYEP
jgi:hypothetical protein